MPYARDCESIQMNSSKDHLHTKKMRLWAVFCKRKSQKQQINVSEGHLSSANNSQKCLPALGTRILSQSLPLGSGVVMTPQQLVMNGTG